MRAEALELVASEDVVDEAALPPAICLFRDDWHEGIVGLVASRIKDRYHRPVVAFARSAGGMLKGSARSIPGLHIRDALAEVDAAQPGLIARYGGHAMAAGLTLVEEGLDRFIAALQGVVDRHLSPELLEGRLLTDGALAAEHLTIEVAELLREAGPWGQGFPEPSFDGSFVVVDRRIVAQSHLKLKLREPATDLALSAIAFNQADFDCVPGDLIQLVYRLNIDDYGARPAVQLIIEHLQPEPAAATA
jgi:single-stranded-DNA-specific exonuclease